MTPAQYLEWLHRETAAYAAVDVELDALEERRLLVVGAGASEFVRHVAHLWCLGVEDARTYTLLFPVLVDVEECARRGGLTDPGFLRKKLEEGAAWIFVDRVEDERGARLVLETLAKYPACRFLVAGEAAIAGLLQSALTCRSL